MSTRTEVLLWAQRVLARRGQPPYIILDLKEGATPDQAQEAFHKIARTAHPDLHRNGLTPDELELVTSAYAAAAGAYQTLRTQTMTTSRIRALGKEAPPAGDGSGSGPTRTPATPSTSATPSGAAPAGNAAASMSSKALVYYRKAELCLKRGDLRGAMLQVKLAIAADPQSGFLRSALAEIELEVRKGT